MSFSLHVRGSFTNLERYLQRAMTHDFRQNLQPYAAEGVRALASATPKDSGLAANSWTYEITGNAKSGSIVWRNTDVENGFPVAIAIQYGHGTGTGGYVQGRDYINPAIRPIFDQMSAAIDKEVRSL